MVNSQEVEVLGGIDRSSRQIKRTGKKDGRENEVAGKKSGRLVSARESENIDLLEGMIVESVAAKLLIVNMTKEEKNEIEKVKAGVARTILGVGERVSERIAFRELG